MSSPPKCIAVLGSTGQQGGAVAAALLKRDGVEKVVAITRNPESDSAKALAAKSPKVELRKADLNSVDDLVDAFKGCDGAYVIANFWEGADAAKEMQHYKNATDALKKMPGAMKHVVFSTLEETTFVDSSKVNVADMKDLANDLDGKPMKVPHFDSKARAEAYFEGLPTTFMVTSCYFENYTSFFSLVKGEDGAYTFTLPMDTKAYPWTILPDLGELVAGIFHHPELIGKRIGQASFVKTCDEIAEIFSKATGKTVKYNAVPWEVFASFGFPGADELAQMFEFWNRTYDEFCKDRDLDTQLKIMGPDAKFTDPIEYAKMLPLKFEG